MDEVTYSWATVERLVEGGVSKGRHWIEVDGSWADLRSSIERTGDVESEAWLEVLDLENAISALRGDHPLSALAVIAHLWGFDAGEVRGALRNYNSLTARGMAYLTAYLSGEDPEQAYRRPRRRIA